ncbi:MAG: serine/threonine-protein kinase, partial [Rubricoccaceae bacterium]|nr:serine/threonine-protein kinase [Rubricoccaceae bacterium]
MTVLQWERVQTLFEQALEHDPDVRTAFLRRACGDDPALYEEVAALLAADEDTHPLLDGLALDALDVSESELLGSAHRTDDTIGPWRLGERIGRGGMGEVYLAERVEGGFAQTAALKLIKRGMDSEAVVRRFEAERQILARLEHPGIARLVGGGMADDGRPFFAMEYVEGEPITAYCDAHRLSVDARLRLFATVCEAVRYAHRNLVVHRDLKPSNILVSEDAEGRPQVKLLDFGIARLLATDDDALLTQTGHRVLTPAYAAPEQVTGGAVTTATDVYALGGLLYRLLCGQPPIETEGRTAQEVEADVLGAPPPPPSARATPEAAERRGTTPDRLARRLRGDLDTMALVALHKEPERRYGSAAELLDDVTRHLGGLPIEARRDSRGYRLTKFVGRHRAAVLATGGVVALVAVLVGFYTARLAAERDRAQGEADKAAEVSAFLASLFEGADPAQSRGADVTARELLAAGAQRVETELAGQPEVQAEMFGTIGRVYASLGLLDEASAALEKSLARLDAAGADPLDRARAQTALGDLRVSQGNYAAADSLLRRALAVQRAGHDGPHEETAATLGALGDLLQERGDYPASEAPLLDALAMQQALHDGDHPTAAALLNSLGQTYYDLGRYDEAEAHYAEALAMRRRLHGDLHPA